MENVTVIIPRRGINDDGKGKKYALKKLITAAETEYVWLRDDDTMVSTEEEATMSLCLKGNPSLVILPLRMTEGKGTLIERLQQTEYAAIQTLTMLAAERGHAVMCSAANLIVRREDWLEAYSDLHLDLPSGDDMFLLESMKRRGKKIICAAHPMAQIEPAPTLRALLRQRMRWAGKANRYTDRDIRLCGVAVVVANLFAMLCPPFFLMKYVVDVCLIRYGVRCYGLWTNGVWFIAFLLSLLYPWYMLLSLVGGLLQKKEGASF